MLAMLLLVRCRLAGCKISLVRGNKAFHDDGYRRGFWVLSLTSFSLDENQSFSIEHCEVKIRPARALLLLTAETFLRLLGCVLPRQPSVAHHRMLIAPVSRFAKQEQI